ncbi:uncharacterized protein LOC128880932 isoform X1 [Hylaeus volcanicus]|uniref:uncharacterized protein LOC128880932 isoform X1 n=1 Tax=Hylaeus volcanicus TaxID=313075 RepID=UPI0023B7F55F|nr:uncharacterized protein LOC128880932 isoform X1 [Hylaeus volcanicus]
MDRFLNIDWNPPLEDMIDNTFINIERFEQESVMHKILNGNFNDPFNDIIDEYKEIKTDLMSDIEPESDEQGLDDSIEAIDMEKKNRLKQSNNIKRSRYVPCIVKSKFQFPRPSNLNKEQQALCLRVLLRFSESDKPKLTQPDREELQTYMSLQSIISREQDEFLEFAKSKWHERLLKITCEDYINLHWRSKLQYIRNIPRYYAEVTNVPFVADKNIDVKFISDCLQRGHLPNIVLPTFHSSYMLCISSEQLQERFPPKTYVSKESPICSKLPVSEDTNCQELAENNNVDLVISSSGLNCLVNNIGPSSSNSWILPIVIKRHNDKNVIYIDKPAPPSANTVPHKNNWVYKYILKYFLINVEHPISENTEAYYDNIFGEVNSEVILRLEDEYENTSCGINTKTHLNVVGETKSIESNLKQQVNTKENVSYKLFSIGPQSSEQNELMKNVIKEYKMLVRTKTDGFVTLENNVQKLLLLAPKLEHQVDLGAEAVTLEESLKQWISLVFRPFTFLARVRINAETSEILQVEHRTAMSISNEIKRLYNIKVEDSLTILHNVVQSLANLSPGRYVMRHTVRNGSFATVYKEVESPGKNIFDIHTVYDEQYHTLHNSPWIPLDKIVPTPMVKHFERMPAMFHPKLSKPFLKNRKPTKIKESNTGTVRRSLRNKKKEVLND